MSSSSNGNSTTCHFAPVIDFRSTFVPLQTIHVEILIACKSGHIDTCLENHLSELSELTEEPFSLSIINFLATVVHTRALVGD